MTKPPASRLTIGLLILRLAWLRLRLAWGCWLTGTSMDELRRQLRLRKLTGRL